MAKSEAQDARFARAVEAIYGTTVDPQRWPDALQAMADVLGDVGAILVYGRDDGLFAAIESPSLHALIRDYVAEFGGNDFRAIRARERGYFLARDAITDRDVASSDEIAAHPFYRMLARHRLRYFAAGQASPDPRVNAAISIQRAIDKDPYTEEELRLVERLCRHAENALRLSIRLFGSELAKLGLSETLDRLSIGVFALDSGGRVIFSNAIADALVGDGLYVRDGRLQVGSPPVRVEIEDAIARSLATTAELPLPVPRHFAVERTEIKRPLILHVLPVRRVGAEPDALVETRAVVTVTDSGVEPVADPTLVRDLLGLTLGEARVATLVGSGLGAKEAAEKLGIAEATARTVLKRVFGKAGISRQSELAGLLSRLLLR